MGGNITIGLEPESRASVAAISTPQTIAEIMERRRAKNAKLLSAALALLMALAACAARLATETPWPVVGLMLTTGAVLAMASFLIHRGRVRLGIIVMVAVLLVEHVTLALDPHAAEVTPFFSSLIVLMAATTLPARWLWLAATASFVAVVAQVAIASAFTLPEESFRATSIASLVLLAFTTTVAWLHVQGIERAFSLAEKTDRQRQQLSRRLQRAGRMEALGRLAGGVAHDFNNFLVVIQSSAELAADDLPAEHPSQGELGRIQQATGRAADLTSQLLAFSRRRMSAPSLLDPAQIVEQTAGLLERLVGPRIQVMLDTSESSAQIIGSRTQLEQVLFNIAANARDAMPAGGTFTVAVRDRTLARGEISELPGGDYVEINLSDTGTGIPAEVMEHMFEPFYSTKGEARGTGLGLSTSFGTISQLGGQILVETQLGKGSSFSVFLPATTRTELSPSAIIELHRDSERALIVDADENVRRAVARVLSSRKCAVEEADSLSSSIAHARTKAPFDVILVDMFDASEQQTEALERLQQLHPEARLVVMSSFSPDTSILQRLEEHGAVLLPKPFSNSQLIETALGRS